MKILIVVVAIAAVFSVAFASSTNLSTSEMDATWGGGNCKVCPGTANVTCSKGPCTFKDGECKEASGGSYKVCKPGTHPEQECYNDDTLTCGTIDYCANNEGGCDKDNYDCSCHSEAYEVTGCA